jgi:hypothetical protein
MHVKRPEGPALSGQRPPLPARAMSAQVKLASPVYPVYPVRRADRGPAPITRLIHLPPPAVPLPDPGPRSYTIVIAHHVICCPGSAARAATGHYRPAQSWPAAPVPSSRLGDVALRRPTRPAPGPGVPRGYHPRIPSLIQSGRSRARYRPGPQCAAPAIKDSAKHLQARPAARLKPRPPPVRASSSRHYAGDRKSDHCTTAA